MSRRGIVRHARHWLPLAVLVVFSIGAAASLFIAHGQDSSVTIQNAIHIAELQHDVQDIKDMPIQFGIMRERQVKMETKVETISKQIDSMEDEVRWIVFGVFGWLASAVFSGFKFGKGDKTESADRVPLIKP